MDGWIKFIIVLSLLLSKATLASLIGDTLTLILTSKDRPVYSILALSAR